MDDLSRRPHGSAFPHKPGPPPLSPTRQTLAFLPSCDRLVMCVTKAAQRRYADGWGNHSAITAPPCLRERLQAEEGEGWVAELQPDPEMGETVFSAVASMADVSS